MKKIINKPTEFVTEYLEGMYLAYPESLSYCNDDLFCAVSKNKKTAKVALASGGGSGHFPLFVGYIGEGLLDGVSIGQVFRSPSVQQMYSVTKNISNGAGVLYIYGNYNGDIMNFEMAAELAENDGIKVEQVIVSDDVASAPRGLESKRRGVAGMIFVYKIAGAMANEMANLDEVKRVAQKANANVRSMGIALSPCIIPEIGKPTFTICNDEMEIGMGIHGEPGIKREKLKECNEIVDRMMDQIIIDLPFMNGDEVAVLVNGLGATPKEELFIILRRVNEILNKKNIKMIKSYVGEYATSMEMTGATISLLKLDNELKRLLLKYANSPGLIQI